MRITVVDLQREPLEFHQTIPAGTIDYGATMAQIGELAVSGRADLIEEHRGPKEVVPDIRVQVAYEGRFETPCARCVEPVEIPISGAADLLFRPSGVDAVGAEHSISPGETEIGYYENGGLLLEDVLREQVLLSLPARTLCTENCKGLCPRCGQNLNAAACSCAPASAEARWSALADLRRELKPL